MRQVLALGSCGRAQVRDNNDPLTREAAGLMGRALWADAGKLLPEAVSKLKVRQKHQFSGCAARDLNPEPAD